MADFRWEDADQLWDQRGAERIFVCGKVWLPVTRTEYQAQGVAGLYFWDGNLDNPTILPRGDGGLPIGDRGPWKYENGVLEDLAK